MKHLLWTAILVLFILAGCSGQSKKEKMENAPEQMPTEIDQTTMVIEDLEEFVEDSLNYSDDNDDDESEEDYEEESEFVEEQKPDFPANILQSDALIVRIDTFPAHHRYILQKLVREIAPVGIATRYIYPKEDRNQLLLDRGNKFRHDFTIQSTNIHSSFDWYTSEPPFVIKNNLGTYLINPHKKPIHGFVIATMDSEPVLYEGENLDAIALIKKHFNIKTKEEFKKIIPKNEEMRRIWLKEHHEQLYKEKFAKSNHNFNAKQIQLLNRFIIDYQLGFREVMAMPGRPYVDEFKGKVKRVNYKYRTISTQLDTTLVNMEYDKGNNLIRYQKYTMSRARYKYTYSLVYSKDGLLESVWVSDILNYKIYSYSDRIIVVKIPSPYDYTSKVIEESIMYITEDGVPAEIETRRYEEKTIGGNAKFVFDKNNNLLHHDFGAEIVYYPRDYEYKDNKLTKVKMKQYVVDGMYDLVYELDKDKVVMKSRSGTFTQKIKYDKKGNILTAIFDERQDMFTTTSYFYEYEYY